MESIFWKGYSNLERHSAINILQDVISKFGDVVDFKLFSDISISMTIEIVEQKLDGLFEELSRFILLEEVSRLNSMSNQERTLYLNVTFVKSTGNMIVEVPSVPG